jgi:hypothetical protein
MNAGGQKEELIRRWQTEFTSIETRNALVQQMIDAKLFPSSDKDFSYEDEWVRKEMQDMETNTGLFPDLQDPLFTEKLFHKREFAELKQRSMSEMIVEAEEEEKRIEEKQARGEKIEQEVKEFEISPVQRFVSRFLSPATPYNSALLYHGVGVGKTCAAITAAEVFLERFPNRPVIILAPPNIQPNFKREIFDINKVKWGDGDTIPNRAFGCTGSRYLELANCLKMKESESSLVKYRVERVIEKRYKIYGYLEFANFIEDIFKKRILPFIKGNARTQKENALLREYFNGRFIIVDEAHNLRESFEAAPKKEKKGKETEVKEGDELPMPEVREGVEDDADADASPEEKKAHEEGKRSAARLMEVLDKAEGTKLMLLTATPMYNDPSDLVFLLNLLLRNDKRAPLSMIPPGVKGSLFTKDKTLTDEGKLLIGNASSAYISFMRGENPLNFPVRLPPLNAPSYTSWTSADVNGLGLTNEEEKTRMLKLPFIPCRLRGFALNVNTAAIQSVKKVTANYNSEIFFAQAANIAFPVKSAKIEECIGNKGFSNIFSLVSAKAGSAATQYTASDVSWMDEATLGEFSPKMEFVIKRLRTCKGVGFVYSRFISAGGLALAIALEVNGYMAAGARSRNILSGKDFVGQCALCEQKANAHTNRDHPFTQAHYVFLSGDTGLSGNNRDSIDKATIASGPDSNINGQRIKVIIGSTVAGEGIDLKFIREIYVLDTWFHLNKLEQILGRGIRNKSHIALPRQKRNVTVYLLTNQFPAENTMGNRETTDMFFYRYALNKAYRMGVINRFIKQNALDCNINYEAVVILGIEQKRYQINSQGVEIKDVDINDQPFTSICDWQSDCEIKCAKPIPLSDDPSASDTLTYDDYGSKYRNSQLRQRLRELFLQRPYYTYADLKQAFGDIPEIALVNLLSEIVNNRNFLFGTPNHQGYITFRNDFYMFQPIRIQDVRIPMSIRAAEYPVKRDSYEAEKVEPAKIKEGLTTVKVVDTEETIQSLMQLWSLFVKWAGELAEPKKTGAMPPGLDALLRKRYDYSQDKMRRVLEELSMVTYFYNNIKATPALLSRMTIVILQFLWDQYLSNEEQFALFKRLRTDPMFASVMDTIWNEQKVSAGSTVGFRMINRSTNTLEYYTLRDNTFSLEQNGVIIKRLDDASTTAGLRANTDTTGYLYGTLNVKRGQFVFKTNVPVAPNEENPEKEIKGRGRECANSSASTYHKDKLYGLGEKAAEPTALRTDLGLNRSVIEQGPRAIPKTNANMICTLTELTLRFFHANAIDTKFWFFRPIATLKTGHPAIVGMKIE